MYGWMDQMIWKCFWLFVNWRAVLQTQMWSRHASIQPGTFSEPFSTVCIRRLYICPENARPLRVDTRKTSPQTS